jgi:hypothetical protein
MPLRTGIVAATLAIKALCHTLTTYRPAIDTVINAAVAAGHISTVQKELLETFLTSAQGACDIIRIVSGY